MRRSVLLAVSLVACSPQYLQVAPPDPADGRAVVLRAGTVLLDEAADTLVVDDDGIDVLGADEVPVGSVVVGQRDGGYLRRVVAVDPIPGGFHLETVPASLRDALLEAHVRVEVPVASQRSSRWDFDPVTLVDERIDSDLGSAHVAASLENGWVTFEPILVVDIEMDADDDDATVQLGFDVAAGIDLTVSADGSVAHAAELPLFATEVPFAFAIGPVPVTGAAEIEVVGGYELAATGLVDGGVHTEGTVLGEVVAGWQDGDWIADYDASSSFDAEPWFEAAGEAEAKVYVTTRVGANLYGATSVDATLTPWVRGEVCDLDAWAVDGGLEGDVGFDLTVLGWEVWSSDRIAMDPLEVELVSSAPGACDP